MILNYILDIVCFIFIGFRRRIVKCLVFIIIKRINLWYKIFFILFVLKKKGKIL